MLLLNHWWSIIWIYEIPTKKQNFVSILVNTKVLIPRMSEPGPNQTSERDLPRYHDMLYGTLFSLEFSVGTCLNSLVLVYFLSKSRPSNSRLVKQIQWNRLWCRMRYFHYTQVFIILREWNSFWGRRGIRIWFLLCPRMSCIESMFSPEIWYQDCTNYMYISLLY